MQKTVENLVQITFIQWLLSVQRNHFEKLEESDGAEERMLNESSWLLISEQIGDHSNHK